MLKDKLVVMIPIGKMGSLKTLKKDKLSWLIELKTSECCSSFEWDFSIFFMNFRWTISLISLNMKNPPKKRKK